jgi:GH18 family chitinase
VPANKITAGLAFYGRTMKVKTDITKELSQFQEIEAGAPKGDSDDAYWNDPYCNVEPAGFSGNTIEINFILVQHINSLI